MSACKVNGSDTFAAYWSDTNFSVIEKVGRAGYVSCGAAAVGDDYGSGVCRC